ncbi:protein hinderin [Solea solea]|uniref:protein hinderin n=1 Tax=Solea solea TaxID=90069 RepID=UPI00272D8525|nr:protein hinderin [Solea solea]
MAAGVTRSGSSGIFWMNGVSDEEQPLVFVPGVDGEVITQTSVNLASGSTSTFSKGGTEMRGTARRSSGCKNEATLKKGGKKQGHLQSDHSGVYTREKVSVNNQSAAERTPSLASDMFLPPSQVISETSAIRSQICLKDLCSEDKRRIANLIEELARVSEEKEVSVQRLKDEQGNFERKIQQLEQQNVVIAQERESLQQQYRECQELLGLYQKYLSQQQSKLNESIAQLSQVPAHNKVLSHDEAHSSTSTTRANGSLFDGSYLCVAANRAQRPQVHRNKTAQTWHNPASLSCACEISPSDGPIKQHRLHKKEYRESHLESCYSCEPCQSSCYGTQQQRSCSSSRQVNGQLDTPKPHDSESLQSGIAMGSVAKEALTSPLLGQEDWEEKRHQLLLQKMQLEMERERLQARLEEQEERLNRQNQQLCQSRLEYSRFQTATQAELSSSKTRTGDAQLEKPPCQDLPSSVPGEAEEQPVSAPLNKSLQTCEEPSEPLRRDMATSPPSQSKPKSASVTKTPQARLDFSLVELLDIISPVPAAESSKSSNRRTKWTQRRPALVTPKPVSRTLLTSATPRPQSTQQDLEESRILEDIFFIC